MAEGYTNKAWENIFNTHHQLDKDISSNGLAYISAEEIKKFGNREPRLMCKFDSRESRPSIFKQKNLSILPIQNGKYILIEGDGYQNLSVSSSNINYLSPPKGIWYETLPLIPRSESQVIDLAFATGLLEDFLEDPSLRLTIRGRLRSKPFDFYFNSQTQKLTADGVQVEIDAGYEGNKIYLIEAKMGEIQDFNIRQLYYPLRMWFEEDISKDVIPILINYANNIISISQYEFEDFWIYSTIKLVKCTRYAFEEQPVKLILNEIIDKITISDQEPFDIPFPQADDLTKVRDTVDLISWGYNSKKSIADFWQVDQRQADYYANAAMYLGFIKRNGSCWQLTNKGNTFVNLPTTRRNDLLCSSIFSYPVFFSVGKFYLQNKILPHGEILNTILEKYLPLSVETIKRRSQTVLSWLNYILKLCD
ncbi:type II restriction enzyme [Legionella quateirensis]|uniref:Uncharacterized protein n=1 Tax=Legionella quateirensis TaxID=45072 RepID=A0A378KQ59_9GAMM|nr:hypothetical protein [Legionella quateirensis]KTD47812.1 hypothetical protein Lqua_2205 [Legionella quateirensis]STY16705.1 Uncharacterised protein [Legionella quateirensis]